MTLRRRKSRKQQVADLLGSYLKLKAAGKAAKGAGKAVKQTPKAVRSIPVIAGAGVAAFFAAKALRGGGEEQPASA
jgi:hypothetical protein